jgi:Lipid A core - O-antigen ligase and related enzymes
MSKNKTKLKKKNEVNRAYLLPIIFVLAIVPLVVRIHIYKTGLTDYPWFSTEDLYTDFSLYYKQWLLVGSACVMLCVLIYRVYKSKKEMKSSKIFIPMAIYAFFTLLSTILSKHSTFGYKGGFEQFESVFALLSYCVLAYYAYILIDTEEDVKYVFKFFKYSIILLCLLGVFQTMGYDFFHTELGKKLILPQKYWSQENALNFNFDKNLVYLTLFNPNYAGVYLAVVSPIILCFFLFAKEIKAKVLYFFLFAGLMISLLGSQSRTGFMGFAASAILLIFFYRKQIITNWKISLTLIGAIIITFFIVNYASNNAIVTRFSNIKLEKTEKPLSSIITNNDDVSITYNNKVLNIVFDAGNNVFNGFLFTDENGQVIDSTKSNDSNIYTLNNQNFSGFQIEPIIYGDILSFRVNIDGRDWVFTNQTDDNTYYYINRYNKKDKIINAESSIFTGYESFASGRGYIWSRTIPLLKSNIIIGSGADSYIFEFPQEDYVGLYNAGFIDQLLTKPHSLYLQMGVQTGIISLVAFLVFYIIYFITSIKIYIKENFSIYLVQIGFAVFVSTFSYMLTGLTNDSTICVAPVFWALMGIGYAINYLINKKQKNY